MSDIIKIDNTKDVSSFLGFDNKELDDYAYEQLKDKFSKEKEKRISGRNTEYKYTAPIGLWNLGNNSLYIGENEIKKDEDFDDSDIKMVNKIKMDADGKMYMTDEEQEDLETQKEENRAFQISLKNDICFHVYRRIEQFGRLTFNELYSSFGAVEPAMFKIIIKDMVNKRYLKQHKDTDKQVVFADSLSDKGENIMERFNNSCMFTEVEVETLEIISDEERRAVLN